MFQMELSLLFLNSTNCYLLHWACEVLSSNFHEKGSIYFPGSEPFWRVFPNHLVKRVAVLMMHLSFRLKRPQVFHQLLQYHVQYRAGNDASANFDIKIAKRLEPSKNRESVFAILNVLFNIPKLFINGSIVHITQYFLRDISKVPEDLHLRHCYFRETVFTGYTFRFLWYPTDFPGV